MDKPTMFYSDFMKNSNSNLFHSCPWQQESLLFEFQDFIQLDLD